MLFDVWVGIVMFLDKLKIFGNSDYKHKAGRGCIGTFDDRSSRQWTPLDFGGRADGKTVSTEALQKALDKSHEKGGTVFLGAGVWLSGPLVIPCGARIRIERGAILKADPKECAAQLAEVAASVEGKPNPRSAFLYAEEVGNIVIDGNGIIDGSGIDLRGQDAMSIVQSVLSDDLKAFEGLSLIPDGDAVPFENLISLNMVTHATIKDITLISSAKKAILMEGSHKILLENIRAVKAVASDDHKVIAINTAAVPTPAAAE